MTAERLMLLGGSAAFLLTVSWVRQRRLSERQAIVWLLLASILLVCGIFPRIIMRVAELAHLSYPAAVLFGALAIAYAFAFSVSVSLTRHRRHNARLTQEIALLKYRVRELETRLASEPDRTPKDIVGRV